MRDATSGTKPRQWSGVPKLRVRLWGERCLTRKTARSNEYFYYVAGMERVSEESPSLRHSGTLVGCERKHRICRHPLPPRRLWNHPSCRRQVSDTSGGWRSVIAVTFSILAVAHVHVWRTECFPIWKREPSLGPSRRITQARGSKFQNPNGINEEINPPVCTT